MAYLGSCGSGRRGAGANRNDDCFRHEQNASLTGFYQVNVLLVKLEDPVEPGWFPRFSCLVCGEKFHV